ncbi:UNVERIFIED_CONTAM: Retrovirus-related Pol polyprotein from transposon TNT 1-94 [Sesamum calycinum]|uniref:Retrovirus-related Pol polyprotein from transposon TNT 1-94 n=1 Tax=Sesamum calycinum TaxID=2727403 RepID=A0AAW2K001_9LAMI
MHVGNFDLLFKNVGTTKRKKARRWILRRVSSRLSALTKRDKVGFLAISRRGSKKRVSENNALHGCYLDPTKVSPELVRTKQEDWLHLPSEEGHVGKQACARTNQDPRDLSMEGLLTDSETESSDLDWYTGAYRARFSSSMRKLWWISTSFQGRIRTSKRIIMALVAHFYLELHQMDVKTAFLNGDLQEEVYMDQLFGFSQEGSEHLVCRLRKSIYGRVFPSVVNGSKVLFLVLYVDDILLASSDLGLLHDTKAFLIRNFEMKDMGEPHMSWALRFTWPLFSSTAAIWNTRLNRKSP